MLQNVDKLKAISIFLRREICVIFKVFTEVRLAGEIELNAN
jgi:hypothetical protein